MKNSKEIEIGFRNELRELLKKWNAELEVNTDNRERIEATIPSSYDKNNNLISEYTCIDLGRWINGIY